MNQFRKSIQYNTISCFNQGFYEYNKRIVIISEKDVENSIKNTIGLSATKIHSIYNGSPEKNINKPKIKIELIEDDCLKVGLDLQKKGYNPVVLNMANPFNSGGGYQNGANAQEENLFRRTNMFMCLRQRSYPIPVSGTIYTKDVVVIRQDEFNNYDFLDEPCKMSFIAAAAWRCDKRYFSKDLININGKYKLNPKIEQITLNTIHSIFKTALINEHDCVVLSALGCGAFNNPPKHIAQLFKQAVEEGSYDTKLKIVFAIYDDTNALINNKEGNVSIFSQFF